MMMMMMMMMTTMTSICHEVALGIDGYLEISIWMKCLEGKSCDICEETTYVGESFKQQVFSNQNKDLWGTCW